METWRAIDSLRVVRVFDGRPLSDEQIMQIAHAGRRAGSSKNMQRWAFVVIRKRERLEDLSKTGPWAAHIAGAAAAIALVTPDPKPDRPLSVMWDLGRAAQNMMLAARDLDIGSCPATVYEHDLVKELLSLPDHQHCEYILSFGHPADTSALDAPKRAGGRLKLSDVVHEVW